jgi:toxin ParE1/3/4
MKRRRFVVTPEARQDLIGIWDYVAEESTKRADEALARLYDSFIELAQSPGIGHYREDLADRRHRFWTVHPYIIAYRWQTTPLQIIVVVHGARDLKAFFDQRTESAEGES